MARFIINEEQAENIEILGTSDPRGLNSPNLGNDLKDLNQKLRTKAPGLKNAEVVIPTGIGEGRVYTKRDIMEMRRRNLDEGSIKMTKRNFLRGR